MANLDELLDEVYDIIPVRFIDTPMGVITMSFIALLLIILIFIVIKIILKFKNKPLSLCARGSKLIKQADLNINKKSIKIDQVNLKTNYAILIKGLKLYIHGFYQRDTEYLTEQELINYIYKLDLPDIIKNNTADLIKNAYIAKFSNLYSLKPDILKLDSSHASSFINYLDKNLKRSNISRSIS